MSGTRTIPTAKPSARMCFQCFVISGLAGQGRATLEEVTEADIVVHVRDAHHPDSEAQREDVLSVLRDLGLGGPGEGDPVEDGLVEVLNKIDLLDAETRERLLNQAQRNAETVALSAATGEGCSRLLQVIDRRFEEDVQAVSA